jgi:hypothetical protein
MSNKIIEETVKRFNFMSNYDVSKPYRYNRTTLREIKGDDKTVFTYDVLIEMRDGKLNKKHPLFEILSNVTDILQLNEEFNSFSDFMQKLKTDSNSVQNSNNYIRKTYNNFKNGKPQHWQLIDPDEYLRCIQKFTHFDKPMFGALEDYWTPRIYEWVSMTKDNVAQLAANSYLVNGPSLDPRIINSKGELTLNRLWFDLTNDKNIVYYKQDATKQSNSYFNKTYWMPFVNYIGTSFGDSDDGSGAYETDSPLDGIFNAVAGIDKNQSDPQQLFVALDRVIHIAHSRGSLAHMFVKGGNAALSKITNS